MRWLMLKGMGRWMCGFFDFLMCGLIDWWIGGLVDVRMCGLGSIPKNS